MWRLRVGRQRISITQTGCKVAMLLYKFTPEQKFVFLRLVRDVAVSDKSLDSGEQGVIRELCAEMGVSSLNVTASLDENALPEIFPTRESRTLVLIELARLSIVDKVFCYGESEILNKVRIKFDFTKKELNDILRMAEIYGLLRQGIRAMAAG